MQQLTKQRALLCGHSCRYSAAREQIKKGENARLLWASNRIMAEKHYITVSISNRRAIMRLRSSTVFQRAKTVCCPRVDIFSEAADSVTVETLSAVLVPPDMCDPTAWRSRIALRNVSVIMGLDTERHHSLHNVPAADGRHNIIWGAPSLRSAVPS